MSIFTTTHRKHGTAAPQTAAGPSAVVKPPPEQVRCRAYEIFQARKGGPGDHISDWIQAEHELSCTSHDVCSGGADGERRAR